MVLARVASGRAAPMARYAALASRHFSTVRGDAVDPSDVLTAYDTTRYRRGGGFRSSTSGTTAVVFGCTGFLGRYIVQELGKNGHQVVVPFRNDEQEIRHLRVMGDLGQVAPVHFSVRDEDSIRRCIEGADVVVNCMGKHYETRNFSFEDIHIDAAHKVADLAAKAGVKRYIHVSALGCEADSESKWQSTKRQGEDAALQGFSNATVVRPAHMVGAEDNLCRRWALYLQYLKFIPLVSPLSKLQPVYVNDVAQAIGYCINHPEHTVGKTYELGGPEVFTYEEFSDLMLQLTGRTGIRHISPYAADWLFTFLEMRLPVINPRPVFTRDQMRQQMVDVVVSDDALTFADLQMTQTPNHYTMSEAMRQWRLRGSDMYYSGYVGQQIEPDRQVDPHAKTAYRNLEPGNY